MKKILLSLLYTSFGIVSLNAQTHQIDLENTTCNAYYVVFDISDAPCGTPNAQTNPILVPANASPFPVIQFSGTTVTYILGTSFSWATVPGTPDWYIVDAHVYNACGVNPGMGCTYPYDELWTGCPGNGGFQYEISNTCAYTDPGCDVCTVPDSRPVLNILLNKCFGCTYHHYHLQGN